MRQWCKMICLFCCCCCCFFCCCLLISREIVNHMRILIDSVETLQQETYKLLGYERSAFKQLQIKQQFLLKRVSNSNCVCGCGYIAPSVGAIVGVATLLPVLMQLWLWLHYSQCWWCNCGCGYIAPSVGAIVGVATLLPVCVLVQLWVWLHASLLLFCEIY